MENYKTFRGLPFISSSLPSSVGIPGKGTHRAEVIATGAQLEWSLDASSIIMTIDSRQSSIDAWFVDGSLSVLSLGYHIMTEGPADFYSMDLTNPAGIAPAIIGSKNKFVRMKVRRLTDPIKANTASPIYNTIGLQYKSTNYTVSPIFAPNNIKTTELTSGSDGWEIYEWNLAYPMIANTITLGVESYTKTIDNVSDTNIWTNTAVRGMRILFDARKSSDRFSCVWKPKGLFAPAIAAEKFPRTTSQEMWNFDTSGKRIVKLSANVSYSRGETNIVGQCQSDSDEAIAENDGGSFNLTNFNVEQEGMAHVYGIDAVNDQRLIVQNRGSGASFSSIPLTPRQGQFLDPPGIDIRVYYRKTDGTRAVISHSYGTNNSQIEKTLWDSKAGNTPSDLSVVGGGACEWAFVLGQGMPANWQEEKWVAGDAVELKFNVLGGATIPLTMDVIEAIVVRKTGHQQDTADPNNRNILYVDSVALHLDDGSIVRIPASQSIYQTKWFGSLSGSIDSELNTGFNGSYVPMIYPGDLVFPGGYSSDGLIADETLNYKPATTTGVTSHSGVVDLVSGLTGEYKVIDMATPRRSWIYDKTEILPWSDPVPDPQNPGSTQVLVTTVDSDLKDYLLLTQNTAFTFDYTSGPGATALEIFRPNLELLEGERIHGPKAAHLAANSNFHLTILDHDDIRNANTQSYSLWYKPTSERVGKYYPGLASASTTMAEAARIITRDRSEFWSLAAHHGKNWMPAAYSTFNSGNYISRSDVDGGSWHNLPASGVDLTKNYLSYGAARTNSFTVNTSFGLFGKSSLEFETNSFDIGIFPQGAQAALGPLAYNSRVNFVTKSDNPDLYNAGAIRIPKGKRWIWSYYAYSDTAPSPPAPSEFRIYGSDSENPQSGLASAIGGGGGGLASSGAWQRFSGVMDLTSSAVSTLLETAVKSKYGDIGIRSVERTEIDTLAIRLDVDSADNTILFDGIMLEQQPDTGITTPSDFVAPSEYLDLYFSGISNTINGGSASDTHALDYLLTSSVANQISSFTTGGLKLDAWNYIALTLDYDTSNTSIYVYNVDDGLTYANTFELPSAYTANVGAAPNWPTSASVYPGTEGRGVAFAGGVESANAISGLISSSDTLSALGTYDNIKYCARTLSYDEINDAFYTRDKYVTGPTYEIDWVEVSDDPFEDALYNKRVTDTAIVVTGHPSQSEVFVSPYTLYVANSTYTLGFAGGQQGTGIIYKVTSNTQDFHTVEVAPFAQSTFITAETGGPSSQLIGPVHMVADQRDNLFALYYEPEGMIGGIDEPGYGQACHIYQFTADCNTYNISHSTHIKVYSGTSDSVVPTSPGQYSSHLNVLEDTYDPYGQNGFDLDESTGVLYLGSPNAYRSETSNSGIRPPEFNDSYNQTGNIIKIIPTINGYKKALFVEIANSITTGHSCRVNKVFSGPKGSVFYIYEDSSFYPPRTNLNQLVYNLTDNSYKNIEVMGTSSSVPYVVNANTISSLSNGVGDVKTMVLGIDGSLYVSRAALQAEYGGFNTLPVGGNLGWIFRIVPDEKGSYAVEDTKINIIAENVGIVNSLDVSDINNIFAFSSSNNVTYGANTISTPIYHLTPNNTSGLYKSFVVMEGASVLASNTGTVMRPSSENPNFDGLNLSGAPFSGTILASSRKTMNVYSSSDGASTDTDYLYEGALWIKSVYSNTVIRITPDANGSYSSASANVHGIMGTGYLSDGSWSSISNNGEGFMSPIALKKVWR